MRKLWGADAMLNYRKCWRLRADSAAYAKVLLNTYPRSGSRPILPHNTLYRNSEHVSPLHWTTFSIYMTPSKD